MHAGVNCVCNVCNSAHSCGCVVNGSFARVIIIFLMQMHKRRCFNHLGLVDCCCNAMHIEEGSNAVLPHILDKVLPCSHRRLITVVKCCNHG